MARTVETYTDLALDAFNAGFSSKAGQKAATDNLNRAYELLQRETIQRGLLEDRTLGGSEEAWKTLYWGTPDLHNWKAKHSAMYAPFFPEAVAAIERLAELRAEIKAAPIVPPAAPEVSPFEVKARETITAWLERRRAQYVEALELAEVFGGLPVTATSHYVTNAHGTTFLRTFWYLRGKLTPLQIIIAAAQELDRRAA